MKTRNLFTHACAFALIANSLATTGLLAQDNTQGKAGQNKTEPKVERVERQVIVTPDGKKVIVQSGDGPERRFEFQGRPFEFKMQEPFDVAIPRIEFGDVLMPKMDFGLEAFSAMPMPFIGQQGGEGFMQFVSTEMSFDVRSAKGVPFSAVTVSESTQVLGDGNRITQHTEGRVYRDSQGRTRTERTLRMGGSDKERQTVVIFDPVTHTNITLDPQTRTARKMGPPPHPPAPPTPPASAAPSAPPAPPAPPSAALNGEAPRKISVSGGVLQGSAIKRVQPSYPPIAKAAQAQGAVQVQTVINETGEVTEATVISGHPLLREAATEAARQWEFKPTELGGKPVKVQGVLTFNFTLADKEKAEEQALMQRDRVFERVGGPNTNAKKEDLGKQMMEGVECTGTRITTAIPAGAIGNERPIEAVRETWYSPELKTTVMSKSTDPRFGESSYRLTGIARSEPEASLFQVPDGYTVKENTFNFRTTAPARAIGPVEQRFEYKMDERRNEIEKQVIERRLQDKIENRIEKKNQQ